MRGLPIARFLDPRRDRELEALSESDLLALMQIEAKLLDIPRRSLLLQYARDARRRVLYSLIPAKVLRHEGRRDQFTLAADIRQDLQNRLSLSAQEVEQTGLPALIREIAKGLALPRKGTDYDYLEELLRRGPYCQLCGYRFTQADMDDYALQAVLPPREEVEQREDAMKPLWRDTSLRRPVIDHVVPTSSFGTNHRSNLELLCRMCNSGKYDFLAYSEIRYASGYRTRTNLARFQVLSNELQLFVAVLLRDRTCQVCATGPEGHELTIAPRRLSQFFVYDNLQSVCYSCDKFHERHEAGVEDVQTEEPGA